MTALANTKSQPKKTIDATWYWPMLICVVASAFYLVSACSTKSIAGKPNFIIILTDDQGYADLGSYGAKGFKTPNLDRLASEGIRFTSFYTPANVCTPSRAALLTGRYPMRVGLPQVLFPRDTIGLNEEELTIAELLKKEGYATKAIGKWHLGAHPKFLPVNHGFDHYFGLPYSNDMSPEPGNNPRPKARKRFPPLPLIEDTTIIDREPDQTILTRRYTESAVKFIESAAQPFFLYLAHNFPHVPLFASEDFRGDTERGLYGDVIREIDWSTGQLLQALEEKGMRENTLIFFTSDNGPWLVFGDHGGSAGNLREGKITTFEGGHRVPAIASWPGQIPPGRVSDEVVTSMDLLPTIARLSGTDLPKNKVIDGYDIWPILSGNSDAESPYEAFYFYQGKQLQAVRSGPWKLHVPHNYLGVAKPGNGGDVGRYKTGKIDLSLYNLEEDPGETKNVADQHPEVVKRLMKLIEKGRNELGDAKTNTTGSQQGEPGRVDRYWQKLDISS